MDNLIIDSATILNKAILIKQEQPVPQEILDQQTLLDVEYFSFDGNLHRGQIVVNKDVAEDVRGAFELIKEIKFPIQSVIPIGDLRFLNDDDKSGFANNSSGFNYRNIAKTNKISNHAFGLGIDINPLINPYIRKDYRQGGNYNPLVPGTITADSELVKYFKERGWEWGGDWTDRKDYMHFEKSKA